VTRSCGWESRLVALLREASVKPYHVRNWNCAVFVHTCAQVVQGRALPFAWKGSLEASVDAVLERVPVKLAQRADVVLANVPEATLGICLGAQAAFVSSRGLITESMAVVVAAWSV
jgi:hypothetical protein